MLCSTSVFFQWLLSGSQCYIAFLWFFRCSSTVPQVFYSFFKGALCQTNICCSHPSTECSSMPQHISNKKLLTDWWDEQNVLRNPTEMSGMWIPFQRLISIQASATTHSRTAGAFRYLNASILSTAAACWRRFQWPLQRYNNVFNAQCEN